MPTDVSRSHDGENRRSDQTSIRRDSSPKSGRVRDFATHQYQIFESQRKGKGLAPADGKDRTRVGEDGKPVEKLKLPDTSGLKGGVRTRNDFLSREQMTEYFNIIRNIPSNRRTRDQNKIVLLVERVDEILEAGTHWSDNEIRASIERSQSIIYDRAGPSLQSDVPSERHDQIEMLVRDLMDNPGTGPQQNSEIRSYMRDNPTTQAEFEYAQAYIRTLTRDTNLIHRLDVSIRNSY